MKVIWYNADTEYYQSGTWNDFSLLRANYTNPDKLLALERFHHESMNVISKIVNELNKCSKKSKMPRA